MDNRTIQEAKDNILDLRKGDTVFFEGSQGKVQRGKIKIKEVRCGKKNCTKCPHKTYAYAQYRDGDRVRSKYIGVYRNRKG